MKLKTKLLAAALVTAGAKNVVVDSADIYRRSVAIHREMSKATRMEWGNPLPFKSEILTKWAQGQRRVRSQHE